MQARGQAQLSADMVQRILDENQQLILAAIENQQSNNPHECAQYLSSLQRNLVMLATLGDEHVNSAGGLLCARPSNMRVAVSVDPFASCPASAFEFFSTTGLSLQTSTTIPQHRLH